MLAVQLQVVVNRHSYGVVVQHTAADKMYDSLPYLMLMSMFASVSSVPSAR